MKISFVIPAYNEEALIGHCLDAIIKETGGRGGFEIIVADNNSTDRTCDIVAHDYPSVKLIHEPKRGANAAREAGFRESTGDFIAFLDADTELGEGWIDRTMRAFEKDKKLVCISGPFIYYDLPAGVQLLVTVFYGISYLVYIFTNFILRKTSVIQGGTEIIRREALEKVGGPDVSLTFYGDDADLARRLSKVGEVRFSFAFAMRSSGRRLAKDGAFTMGGRYMLNYFWILLFNRPFTTTSTVVRSNDGSTAYHPSNALKEWSLIILVAVVFLAILGLIIYGLSLLRL